MSPNWQFNGVRGFLLFCAICVGVPLAMGLLADWLEYEGLLP